MKIGKIIAILLLFSISESLEAQNKVSMKIDSLLDEYFAVSNSHRELALSLAENARKLAQKHGEKHNEAVALECLGVQYYYRGDYNKARDFLNQSLEIYNEENSSTGLASVFTNLALVEQDLGNLNQAHYYYTTSLVYDRNSHDSIGMAFTINNLGTLYLHKGDFQRARAYFQKAYDIGKSVHHLEVIGNSIGNFGLLRLESSNPDSAIPYFRKALSIAKQYGDEYAQAIANINLGLCMIEKSEADSAERYLTIAARTSEELEDNELQIECLLAKAKLMLLLNQPELANRILFSAQKLNNPTERKKTSAQIFTLIGKNLLLMNQPEKVRNYFLQSLDIAKEIGALPEMIDAYKHLAMFYSAISMYDSCELYIDLYAKEWSKLTIDTTLPDTSFVYEAKSNNKNILHRISKNSQLSPLKLLVTLVFALTILWAGMIYLPKILLSLRKKTKKDNSNTSAK